MTPQDGASIVAASTGISTPAAKPGYLFGPVVDFLCLGGGSLIVLAFVALLIPETKALNVGYVMLLVAHLINHPHFAHSYQIFYRQYGRKAFGKETAPALRFRYLFAGIVVPILLTAFFATTIAMGEPKLLGFGANIMLFFVGWHYVKQGYGMIMVDAVLKKQFFKDHEKTALRVNAYIGWATAYLVANRAVAENDMWGLKYYAFEAPSWLLTGILTVAALSLAATLVMFYRRFQTERQLPWIGVTAYLTSIYIWLFPGIDPIFILIIPACHSLQYLVVVWRYQLNIARDQADGNEAIGSLKIGSWAPTKAGFRFLRFCAFGIILGFAGFWLIPLQLDGLVSYDTTLFGSSMFLFVFWVFINLHHYFMDNVMWRRENPETKKYLFSHG